MVTATNCRLVVEIPVVVLKVMTAIVDRKRHCMCTCDSHYIHVVLPMKITALRL